MRVLRVEIEAPTTSFRYPQFMVGRHPTYPMPPPSTIHGLVCAAAGELLSATAFRFAYHFASAAPAQDLEHVHVIERARSGRIDHDGTTVPRNTDATVTPTARDFLFGATLTLYLDSTEMGDCFVCPRYAISLGRSQDLASIRRVSEVELQETQQAYLENTVLPAEARLWAGRGIVATLPRYLDPSRGREPSYAHYLFLRERLVVTKTPAPELEAALGPQRVRSLPDATPLWTDPDTPEYRGTRRAVWFHGFV